jgi:hypothetical protein
MTDERYIVVHNDKRMRLGRPAWAVVCTYKKRVIAYYPSEPKAKQHANLMNVADTLKVIHV